MPDETLPPSRPDGEDSDSTPSPDMPTLDRSESPSYEEATLDSADPRSGVNAAIHRQHSAHDLDSAGYEVVGELGRGGMGIVYKARDTKLERTVAVKMILGGQFASEAEIQRFRLEGEAAARLDHPGIVPVYEVGEVKGNHFFSMKYIEGGALNQNLERFQGSPRVLVELVIKIARAVQHAHQRGVLHRDLKPANILINERGEPVITDLGLAKRMDDESGLTQTGFALGTPGFMAPEQAEGRKDITTATDIFSIGAVLYWLITGNAPFQGESPMQIVMATIKESTPSLRTLRPDADRDLDLICQRAMAKNPAERYSSAGAFADDLQAWLDGDMLSVRAPTAVSVASVWIRKNLRSVLASSFTGLLCGVLVGGLLLVGELRSLGIEYERLRVLGESKETWARWATAFRGIPYELAESLEFLIIPVVAVCSFLNVWLVRPASRDSNVVSAATAAFLAGAIAFVISIGWPSVSQNVVDRGYQDIQLIAGSMFLETEVEQQLAKQALVKRYPGIEDVQLQYRGDMIRRKIAMDQESGIMPGLWAAIFRAACWVVVPLGVSSVLSGMLWSEGVRGGLWFGLTWERAAYVFLSAIFAFVCFQPIGPPVWVMLVTAGAIVFSLTLAIRRAHFIPRIVCCVVTTALFMYLAADVRKLNRSYQYIATAKNDAQLREKIYYNDRVLEKFEYQERRYQSAITWLYLQDEGRYQMHCQKIYDAFQNAYRPEVASRIAKVCLLRPNLQPQENLPTLVSMAELGSKFESSDLHHWFCMTRAIAELRTSNHAGTLEWNAKCREEDPGSTYLTATTYLVDALALRGLGRTAEAKASLDKATERFEADRVEVIASGADYSWENRLVYRILEREMQGLDNSVEP